MSAVKIIVSEPTDAVWSPSLWWDWDFGPEGGEGRMVRIILIVLLIMAVILIVISAWWFWSRKNKGHCRPSSSSSS